jgi:hypothetical protein
MAPAPLASASGIAPLTIAPVVIRIGRRRSEAASTTASCTLRPSPCRRFANCTIRMPCLVMSPISVTSPIWL